MTRSLAGGLLGIDHRSASTILKTTITVHNESTEKTRG